jgi:hypothetical protein
MVHARTLQFWKSQKENPLPLLKIQTAKELDSLTLETRHQLKLATTLVLRSIVNTSLSTTLRKDSQLTLELQLNVKLSTLHLTNVKVVSTMMAWLNSSKTTTMSKKSLHQELNASVLKS